MVNVILATERASSGSTMARFQTTTCYHCNAEGTGQEHVPPKCLFPKGGNWSNLMTVPSCVEHNNSMSKADEYLKFLLGAIASDVPHSITGSAARSAVRLAQMGSGKLHKYGFKWHGKVLAIDNDFPLDFELLTSCLAKVARAIYFYHHVGQRKLLGPVHVVPLFIPIDPLVAPELASSVGLVQTAVASDFEKHSKFGSHQEIFTYQILERSGSITINMEFYKAHRVSVMSIVE